MRSKKEDIDNFLSALPPDHTLQSAKFDKKTFILFHNVLVQKLIDSYQKLELSTGDLVRQSIEGFNELKTKYYYHEATDTFTLEKLINQHPNVKKMYNHLGIKKSVNFGKYIYEKKRKALSNNNQIINIKGKPNALGLFLFLGCTSLEDFKEKVQSGEIKIDTTDSLPIPTTATLPIEGKSNISNFNYYLGFYYSIRYFNIRTFVLAIDFSDEKNIIVKEWGFQSIEEDAPVVINEEEDHYGHAHFKNSYLFMNLKSKDGYHLNLISNAVNNYKATQAQPFFRGTIQGVSLNIGRLLSAEIYLVKATKSNITNYYSDHVSDPVASGIIDNYDLYNNLCFYLMMERRFFRTRQSSKPSSLYVRNVNVKNIKHITGTYRIWHFLNKGNDIIQSWLTINKNGKAFLYVGVYNKLKEATENKKRPCVIYYTTELQKNMLCVCTFTEDNHLHLTNFAIIDLNTLNTVKDQQTQNGKVITMSKQLFKGSFCSIGNIGSDGIGGGFIALCKESDTAMTINNHQVRIITEQEQEQLMENSMALTKLFEALRNLNN